MRFVICIVMSIVLFMSFSIAAESFRSEGAATLASDYYFRGISQTDNGPAIQGSISVIHQDGWYASAWGSNIRFGEGSMELDLSLGRAWSFDKDWALDVGVIQYLYPEGNDNLTGFNYMEGYIAVDYKDWSLGLALTDSYFGNDVGKYWYLSLSWQQMLSDSTYLNWHVGYNQFNTAQELQTFLGSSINDGSAYTDWGLSLLTKQIGIDWSLSFIGNSINSSACFDICDKRLIFALAKSF